MNDPDGLNVALTETKTAELKDALLKLLQANVLNTRLAVCVAGLASWAPIVSHFWRANTDAKKQKEAADVYRKVPPQCQVSIALLDWQRQLVWHVAVSVC